MSKSTSYRNTFSVGFVARSSKANATTGLVAIEMTICCNGERIYLTLPRKVNPEDFRKQMSSKRGNEIKSYTSAIAAQVQGKVNTMVEEGKQLSVKAIKDAYLGKDEVKDVKVSELFAKYLELNKDRVGVSMCLSVFKKYQLVRDRFIDCNGDVVLSEIDNEMVKKFYIYLEKVYKGSTAQGYMTKFKSVILYALNNGMLKTNPFNHIKIKRVAAEVQFLDTEELERIEKLDTDNERISRTKDLFLFQCYTGLSYIDMAELRKEDCTPYGDGYLIKKDRIKTGVGYTVYLLPKAIAILEKYNWELPVLSNQKYNVNLKIIADWCKIGKPLHSHIARHTAATQFLNHGLNIDVVARILGHSNTNQTKHYAKLLDSSVADAMRGMM